MTVRNKPTWHRRPCMTIKRQAAIDQFPSRKLFEGRERGSSVTPNVAALLPSATEAANE